MGWMCVTNLSASTLAQSQNRLVRLERPQSDSKRTSEDKNESGYEEGIFSISLSLFKVVCLFSPISGFLSAGGGHRSSYGGGYRIRNLHLMKEVLLLAFIKE